MYKKRTRREDEAVFTTPLGLAQTVPNIGVAITLLQRGKMVLLPSVLEILLLIRRG